MQIILITFRSYKSLGINIAGSTSFSLGEIYTNTKYKHNNLAILILSSDLAFCVVNSGKAIAAIYIPANVGRPSKRINCTVDQLCT